MRGLAIGKEMFVHLSIPSPDAACSSLAETLLWGINHRCVWASAGYQRQSQPAQPSQDSC